DLAHYFLKEHAETLHALFQQRSQSQSLPQDVGGVAACPSPSQITEYRESITRDASTVGAGQDPRTVPTAPALEQRISIIGISGYYPQSPNLDTFWSNLESGRDCIVEIPQERWDYRKYFQPKNGMDGKTGDMYCKWGGFLSDVDTFDASFFHISPLEARL